MSEFSFEVSPQSLALIGDAEIEANFEAAQKWLEEELAPYASMVVTEDGIANAKATRAKVRKLSAALDEQRKTIKKAWMAPYEAFEQKCKRLIEPCNAADVNIGNQIKAFDELKRQEKVDRLRVFFNENSVGITDFLKFEDIFSSKWGNATYSENIAQNEIKAVCEKTREDITTIRELESEFEPSLLDHYANCHDIGSCLRKEKTLKELRDAQERRKAEFEAQGNIITTPAIENASEGVSGANEDIKNDNVISPPPGWVPLTPTEKTYTYVFEITGTKDQLTALRAFFDESGIEWKKSQFWRN